MAILNPEDRDELLIRVDERMGTVIKKLDDLAEEDRRIEGKVDKQAEDIEQVNVKVVRITAFWGGITSLGLIATGIKVFFFG